MAEEARIFRYTRHTRNRLRLWKLTEGEVERAVSSPEQVTPSVKSKRNAWMRRGDRWLRVTFIEERQETVIITVTLRRKGP